MRHFQTGLFHSGNTIIERHKVMTASSNRKGGSCIRLDCTKTIALDTRYLDKPIDRITCHAKVMLKGNFCGILYLLSCATTNST